VTIVRFLALVLVLNVARYLIAGAIEVALIFDGLFGAMEASPEYFNTSFAAWDWVSSYGYNFVMWSVAAWVFHLLRPVLKGTDVIASLKAFGLMWIMFAAVSAVYMNHYSHPKDFYVWSIADAVIAFGVVALVNGLIYRKVMGPGAATWPGETATSATSA
jgi:hypothetical protein